MYVREEILPGVRAAPMGNFLLFLARDKRILSREMSREMLIVFWCGESWSATAQTRTHIFALLYILFVKFLYVNSDGFNLATSRKNCETECSLDNLSCLEKFWAGEAENFFKIECFFAWVYKQESEWLLFFLRGTRCQCELSGKERLRRKGNVKWPLQSSLCACQARQINFFKNWFLVRIYFKSLRSTRKVLFRGRISPFLFLLSVCCVCVMSPHSCSREARVQ